MALSAKLAAEAIEMETRLDNLRAQMTMERIKRDQVRVAKTRNPTGSVWSSAAEGPLRGSKARDTLKRAHRAEGKENRSRVPSGTATPMSISEIGTAPPRRTMPTSTTSTMIPREPVRSPPSLPRASTLPTPAEQEVALAKARAGLIGLTDGDAGKAAGGAGGGWSLPARHEMAARMQAPSSTGTSSMFQASSSRPRVPAPSGPTIAVGSGSLLDGEYDEAANANSFREALQEWRQGGGGGDTMPSASGATTVPSTRGLTGPSLLDGEFNEDASASSFQDALNAWRGKPSSTSRPSTAAMEEGGVQTTRPMPTAKGEGMSYFDRIQMSSLSKTMARDVAGLPPREPQEKRTGGTKSSSTGEAASPAQALPPRPSGPIMPSGVELPDGTPMPVFTSAVHANTTEIEADEDDLDLDLGEDEPDFVA